MKLIIELSNDTYKNIKEENSIYDINNGLSARITGEVVGAIKNAKPLPAGYWFINSSKEIIHIAEEFNIFLESISEQYGWDKDDVQFLIKQFLMCEDEE